MDAAGESFTKISILVIDAISRSKRTFAERGIDISLVSAGSLLMSGNEVAVLPVSTAGAAAADGVEVVVDRERGGTSNFDDENILCVEVDIGQDIGFSLLLFGLLFEEQVNIPRRVRYFPALSKCCQKVQFISFHERDCTVRYSRVVLRCVQNVTRLAQKFWESLIDTSAGVAISVSERD